VNTAILKVTGLAVRYGAVLAVEQVDLGVAEGEHVTLLGPSGCGKTTTLRAIAGLERPTAGCIEIAGNLVCEVARAISVPPERRGLAMVFQSYAIWPHMTVFENVGFSFRARGIGRGKARPAVQRALELVDLAGFADRPASRLSGGQQQRVALARALASDSKIILFDEPLSNLDAQLRVAMRGELNELRRRLGFSAIYVTHDQEEAFALSDRIVVMRAGRIEQQGTPTELHRSPRTRFVAGFLGMTNILPVETAGDGGTAPLAPRVPAGIFLQAHDPWGTATSGAGCAIGFRPIDVRVDARPLAKGIQGVINRVHYLGDAAHYYIRSGSLEICVHDRPREDLAEGREVSWQVVPELCIVLRE